MYLLIEWSGKLIRFLGLDGGSVVVHSGVKLFASAANIICWLH